MEGVVVMKQRQEPISYDFRRASKLSPGHVRSFLRVSEKVSRQLGNQLSLRLDKFTTGFPGSIRQESYEDFTQNLSPLAIVITATFPPLKGEFQLIVSNRLIHACTEFLLGGHEVPLAEKLLTEIDRVLIGQLAEEWLQLYADSFSFLTPISAQLERIELAQDFNFPIHLRERVIIVESLIQMGALEESVELVIPVTALEELVPYLSLSETPLSQNEESTPASRELLQSGVYDTDLTLQAVLGECTLDLRDLLSLQTGDTLRLSTAIDDFIPIYIDQKVVYKGQVGLHRGKRAIQIVEQEDAR